MRAFWTYYTTINAVNLCFSVLVALLSLNPLWLSISFCSAGFLAGVVTYEAFFKNQYYFYHNLGYSKKKLLSMTYIINLFPALLLFILYIIIF